MSHAERTATNRSPQAAMSAARSPVGIGTTPLYAQLLALALIALGVIAVRDALVRAGAVGGTSWTESALESLDDLSPSGWMVPVFILAIIVGVVLLLPVLKPRPRKSVALSSHTGVFLRTPGLSRIARESTSDVDGVTDVRAKTSRRRLKITAHTFTPKQENAATEAAIRDRLSDTLEALARSPRLKVTVKNERST